MKRGWKTFWIVCGICAGIGLACCAISFVMGVTVEAIEDRFPNGIGFIRADKGDYDDGYYDYGDDDYDDDDYDDDDYDDDDYDDDDDYGDDDYAGGMAGHSQHHGTDSADAGSSQGNAVGAVTNKGSRSKVATGSGSQTFTGVDEIDVYMWGGVLEVEQEPLAAGEVTVELEDIDKKLGLKCYMDGNELKLETRKKIVGIPANKIGKVTLHVPKDYQFLEASLELVGGRIHVEDIHADELSVDVGAGEGVVEAFTALEADLKCGAGSLTAAGAADVQTEIDCGVGEVVFTASGKESDYNYDIDCGIGQILCGEGSYSGIGAERTVNNHAAKNMEISCGMGSVVVNFAGM